MGRNEINYGKLQAIEMVSVAWQEFTVAYSVSSDIKLI